jgi:hypothetical protein
MHEPLVKHQAVAGDATPIGEGWSRHNPEILVHQPSQIYFAQRGDKRGKYLVKGEGAWTVCPAPHVGSEFPIEVLAAAASAIRPHHAATETPAVGSRSTDAEKKLERGVVIADLPKTARLALKFPLGFLDTPAAVYALFSSLRGNVGAAHWCASQFHRRLLPEIAKKIHGWWDSEAEMPEELLYRGSHVGSLSKLLREHLEGLDRDLIAGPHCFGGCELVMAVLIGENFVVAAAGRASATVFFDDAEAIPILATPGKDEGQGEEGDAEDSAVFGKLQQGQVAPNGAFLGQDLLLRRAKSAWDARENETSDQNSDDPVTRILCAPDAFAVLGIAEGGPENAAEARTAYKRLALRVHPDKVRDSDSSQAKAAFERVESATRCVEALAENDLKACRELHHILRSDPLTVRGSASILKVEADAEENHIYKALEEGKKVISKVQNVHEADAELRQSLEFLRLASQTLRVARQGSPGTAGERLLSEGVAAESIGALGLRDLRGLELGSGVGIKVGLQVRTASWRVGEGLRVALCAGATAELSLAELNGPAKVCQWQPRVAALQWAGRALSLPSRQRDSSASAICICVRDRLEEDGAEEPVAKRLKGVSGPKCVRVRHLLLRCAEPGKPLLDDPQARRKAKAKAKAKAKGDAKADVEPEATRTPAEAEAKLIELLHEFLPFDEERRKDRLMSFRKLCQLHSECESADNAGQLCGDIGWISRGQVELNFEVAAFSLHIGEISDVTATSRGVHLIQRLA